MDKSSYFFITCSDNKLKSILNSKLLLLNSVEKKYFFVFASKLLN